MIGIFWIYEDQIYSYKEELCEEYNQDVEVGHVDFWEQLQSQHKNIREFSYDYIPRGRVLLSDGEIIVYSSNDIIRNDKYRKLILECFALNNAKFIYDEHYQKILDLGFDI